MLRNVKIRSLEAQGKQKAAATRACPALTWWVVSEKQSRHTVARRPEQCVVEPIQEKR
jgi:hypothetical protein